MDTEKRKIRKAGRKLIIPFCTSGGSDIDETMPTFIDSCEGLAVYGERRISGSSQVGSWLTRRI